MKICKVIFSTNRPEYLVPTLESFSQNLDFGDHEVFGVFIDDYPLKRDNDQIRALAEKHGYHRIVLHEENIGLTRTWNEFFEMMAEYEFDYIWHTEDDVVLLQPVKIDDLIELIQKDENLCHLSLKRNTWYFTEKPTLIEDSDVVYDKYRCNKQEGYFNPMASLYPFWVSKLPYKELTGSNPSEAVIMFAVRAQTNFQRFGYIVKNLDGTNIIDHIGEYSKGSRLAPGEPGWENFGHFDPVRKHSSRTGQDLGEV